MGDDCPQCEPVVDLGVQLGVPLGHSQFSVSLRGEKPRVPVRGVISDHPVQPEYGDLDSAVSRNVEFRARLSQIRI